MPKLPIMQLDPQQHASNDPIIVRKTDSENSL